MSVQLTHCTLTGVDETTDLDRLTHLSQKFPLVEWGFLYSPKRQGLPGRYPSVGFIQNAFSELPEHARIALHLCGEGVFDLLNQEKAAEALVHQVAEREGRIQLNFNQMANPVPIDALREVFHRFPSLTIITQHNAANHSLWQALYGFPGHAVLFDASCGRGLHPDKWEAPLSGISCGYAGGFGPETLDETLRKIAEVAGSRPTWIDMENKLRNLNRHQIDQFDLGRCEDCLEIVVQHAVPVGTPQLRLISNGETDHT